MEIDNIKENEVKIPIKVETEIKIEDGEKKEITLENQATKDEKLENKIENIQPQEAANIELNQINVEVGKSNENKVMEENKEIKIENPIEINLNENKDISPEIKVENIENHINEEKKEENKEEEKSNENNLNENKINDKEEIKLNEDGNKLKEESEKKEEISNQKEELKEPQKVETEIKSEQNIDIKKEETI